MPDYDLWHALTDDTAGSRRARPRPDAAAPSEASEALLDAALAVVGAARTLLDLADRRLQARRGAPDVPAEPARRPGPASPAPPPPDPARTVRLASRST